MGVALFVRRVNGSHRTATKKVDILHYLPEVLHFTMVITVIPTASVEHLNFTLLPMSKLGLIEQGRIRICIPVCAFNQYLGIWKNDEE